MMDQGKSTKSVFEAMYMKNLQESQEEKQIDTSSKASVNTKSE